MFGGNVIEYYIRAYGNGLDYDVTYLYGDDGSSNRTCDESEAQGAPYSFTIGGSAPVVPAAGPLGLMLTMLGLGGLVRRRR